MVQLSPISVLVVLYTLLASHLAFAISKDQIEIKFNKAMAEKERMIYGTQAQIAGLSDWEDGEIVHLAMVAYSKMVDYHKAEGREALTKHIKPAKLVKEPPGVLTALIIDNTAYLSSSLKGGYFIYNQPEVWNRHKELGSRPCAGAVKAALVACQADSSGSWGHQNGASCGEVWAAQAFCSTHTDRSLQGSKVVTIWNNKKPGSEGEPVIAPPCAPVTDTESNKFYAGSWGCTEFTEKIGMYVIPETTQQVKKDAEVSCSDITY